MNDQRRHNQGYDGKRRHQEGFYFLRSKAVTRLVYNSLPFFCTFDAFTRHSDIKLMLIILLSLNLKSEMVYNNDQPKKSASRVPRGRKDHRSLVGCWRLDVGPSHRLPGYCPLSTRLMESWGFIRRDIEADIGTLCMQQNILPPFDQIDGKLN